MREHAILSKNPNATLEVDSDDGDQRPGVLETPPPRRSMFTSPYVAPKELNHRFEICGCWIRDLQSDNISNYHLLLPRTSSGHWIPRPLSHGLLDLRARHLLVMSNNSINTFGWNCSCGFEMCNSNYVYATGIAISICGTITGIGPGDFIFWGYGAHHVAWSFICEKQLLLCTWWML